MSGALTCFVEDTTVSEETMAWLRQYVLDATGRCDLDTADSRQSDAATPKLVSHYFCATGENTLTEVREYALLRPSDSC